MNWPLFITVAFVIALSPCIVSVVCLAVDFCSKPTQTKSDEQTKSR